jgi:hypothetical protein
MAIRLRHENNWKGIREKGKKKIKAPKRYRKRIKRVKDKDRPRKKNDSSLNFKGLFTLVNNLMYMNRLPHPN